MDWMIYAFLTAFFESLKDVASKKNLVKQDSYLVSWSVTLFALPFLLPFFFFVSIPEIKPAFWTALFIGGGLNVLAIILYMRALQSSALSLTVPLLTFTPLFMLFTSPIIVGEAPKPSGIIGIICIIAGSSLLYKDSKNQGYLQPFRKLLRNRSSQQMLFISFIWSITSNFDKIGVQSSSPLFWSTSIVALISLVMAPIVLYRLRSHKLQKNMLGTSLILPGFFFALTLLCQMEAIRFTFVAYIIAIKRTSGLLGVCWGYVFFKEKNIRQRLLGASVMFLGVLIICLGSD